MGHYVMRPTMLGVRNILKALKKNEAVCFAADQVPKRGMGEYINFWKRCLFTTLVQSLAVKTKQLFCIYILIQLQLIFYQYQ